VFELAGAGRPRVAWREVFSGQSGKEFTEHEQKLLKGIGKVLSTRYKLLLNASGGAELRDFNGLPEDHYVSGFLDPMFLPAQRRWTKSQIVSLGRLSCCESAR